MAQSLYSIDQSSPATEAQLIAWLDADPSECLGWRDAASSDEFHAVDTTTLRYAGERWDEGTAAHMAGAVSKNYGAYAARIRANPAAFAAWVAARPKAIDHRIVQSGKDIGSHVQIIEDTYTMYTGSDPKAYADEYMRTVPADWRESVILFLDSGARPVIVRWTAERVHTDTIGRWAKHQDKEYMWKVLPEYRAGSTAHRVLLPPRASRPALTKASALARPSVGRLVTGWGLLDRQTRGAPGVPFGSRVIVQGPAGASKTTVALAIAEAACEQSYLVLWIAQDEAPDRIQTRRLQRRGYSPADAQAMPAEGLANLDALPFHVETGLLEDLWEMAHGEATGAPMLVVIDSLQRVRSNAADGRGEREGLEATLAAIQECQRQWPATVIATSEVARASGASKGSGGIDYTATLQLVVSRTGTAVNLKVLKNRDGTQEPFALRLDSDRQALIDASAGAGAVAPAPSDRGLWLQVQQALERLGGEASRSKIQVHVKGRTDAVIALLNARVASGELAKGPKGYSLPVHITV